MTSEGRHLAAFFRFEPGLTARERNSIALEKIRTNHYQLQPKEVAHTKQADTNVTLQGNKTQPENKNLFT
ncbi:MAG: hypothetical protein ACK4NV_05125 [Pannonibacter sp.]|jgi:hypothetical protein